MTTITIDSRGTACPGPITDLIRAYRKSNNGDILQLVATDPGVKSDAKAWCERTKNELTQIVDTEGTYTVLIRVTAKKQQTSQTLTPSQS